MKNKTTYEMDDIMGLITRDLKEKGLSPDTASVTVWAVVDRVRICANAVEIEADVSWVGAPVQDDAKGATAQGRSRRDPEVEPDLLGEAPPLHNRPFVTFGDLAPDPGEIGINDATTTSQQIVQGGGKGIFSPERVKRRLTDGESTEYPGTPPRGR